MDPFFVMALFGALCGGLGLGIKLGLRLGERHGRSMAIGELAIEVFRTASRGVHPRPDESAIEYTERIDERAARAAWSQLRDVFLLYATRVKEEQNAGHQNQAGR